MLVVDGVYHFRSQRLAFRNDYCLFCGKPRRAVQTRTFDVWHLFGIPLLPLGYWKRWYCTVCGRPPHLATKTRRPFKWAGLAVLLVFSIMFWVAPVMPDFRFGSWLFRIGAPIGAIILLLHLIYTPKGASLKERLGTVDAATDTICPFCGTQLLVGPLCSCPLCGVVRR